jgi:hypothetical protein
MLIQLNIIQQLNPGQQTNLTCLLFLLLQKRVENSLRGENIIYMLEEICTRCIIIFTSKTYK